MISDRELWACANTLIQQHGVHVHHTAEHRAGELLASGQTQGHHTFLLIAERIDALQRTTSDGQYH